MYLNYTLEKTVADNIKQYGEEVSSILRQNFYADVKIAVVDVKISAFLSAKIAVDMIYKVESLFKEDAFNLAKFSSNHIELLK